MGRVQELSGDELRQTIALHSSVLQERNHSQDVEITKTRLSVLSVLLVTMTRAGLTIRGTHINSLTFTHFPSRPAPSLFSPPVFPLSSSSILSPPVLLEVGPVKSS